MEKMFIFKPHTHAHLLNEICKIMANISTDACKYSRSVKWRSVQTKHLKGFLFTELQRKFFLVECLVIASPELQMSKSWRGSKKQAECLSKGSCDDIQLSVAGLLTRPDKSLKRHTHVHCRRKWKKSLKAKMGSLSFVFNKEISL